MRIEGSEGTLPQGVEFAPQCPATDFPEVTLAMGLEMAEDDYGFIGDDCEE